MSRSCFLYHTSVLSTVNTTAAFNITRQMHVSYQYRVVDGNRCVRSAFHPRFDPSRWQADQRSSVRLFCERKASCLALEHKASCKPSLKSSPRFGAGSYYYLLLYRLDLYYSTQYNMIAYTTFISRTILIPCVQIVAIQAQQYMI